ncbi:MAG TPA: hypothetical protein VIK74_11495 [Parasegetibacter sp.]|jgi:hypothetical protein
MKTINEFEVKDGDVIVVWFSCGAASAVATMKTIEKYGNRCKIRVVNSPIKEEDEDNKRFLTDVENWLGIKVESATNIAYPSCSAEEVWRDRRFMSGRDGAPCTGELKKEARYQYECRVKINWHVLGFTADEKHRYDRFTKFERENVLPILIEAGITKADCFGILKNVGIEIPRMYRLGYPNANCIGCVKATSPTYWNHVRRMHPEVFEARARLSREIGCRLVRVKGKRIFLDELDPNAKGRSMKNLNHECGIFCDLPKIPKYTPIRKTG